MLGNDRPIVCWVTYLRIDADDFVALLAAIREHALVALDAVRVLVPQHVALPGQRLVALPATEVATVPVLVHRLRVLATENQLEKQKIRIAPSLATMKFRPRSNLGNSR